MTKRASSYDEIPNAAQEWKTISTERNGPVNISRVYGKPVPQETRAVAWLKTTITSDGKQTKKVDIGWTRELWVFVNGKLVYADQNLFESDDARKVPDRRCSLENGSFTLPWKPARMRSRWHLRIASLGGIKLRLDHPEGIDLAEK